MISDLLFLLSRNSDRTHGRPRVFVCPGSSGSETTIVSERLVTGKFRCLVLSVGRF